jgi:hypothetical protein
MTTKRQLGNSLVFNEELWKKEKDSKASTRRYEESNFRDEWELNSEEENEKIKSRGARGKEEQTGMVSKDGPKLFGKKEGLSLCLDSENKEPLDPLKPLLNNFVEDSPIGFGDVPFGDDIIYETDSLKKEIRHFGIKNEADQFHKQENMSRSKEKGSLVIKTSTISLQFHSSILDPSFAEKSLMNQTFSQENEKACFSSLNEESRVAKREEEPFFDSGKGPKKTVNKEGDLEEKVRALQAEILEYIPEDMLFYNEDDSPRFKLEAIKSLFSGELNDHMQIPESLKCQIASS